jgi:ABC-type amino acid transport substrate-binding protein
MFPLPLLWVPSPVILLIACSIKRETEGFSIELIRAVARAAGIEVKFKIGAWNVIHTELEKGEIDALPIVGFNSEREEKFEFSMPYLTLNNAFFIRKGTHGINSIDDLRDKEILVMNEDNAEYFLRREKLTDIIYTTTSFEEAFVKLESGQHDAVFVQRLTGIKILENMKIRSIEPLTFSRVIGFCCLRSERKPSTGFATERRPFNCHCK